MQPDSFGKLLQFLGPGEEAAAGEYRRLHERLARFFEWNNVRDPARLADEALDRLSKRLADADASSEPVRNPQAFASGIARLLLQEERRRVLREEKAVHAWETQQQAGSKSQSEAMESALEACLEKLPAEQRTLIEKYYAGNGSGRAQQRQELADALGLQMNALRNRALRARQRLEICMRGILEQ